MGDRGFIGRTFSAPESRCIRLAEEIGRYAGARSGVRILDLGCGTGRQLFELSRLLPSAELIGVDISESNIRVAREEQAASFAGKGISFYALDYMDFQASPFDLIISDSTLHNIAAPTEALFSKIADDLKPGGHLLATMPYPCAYNHLIWAVRRLLLKVRSSRTDAVIYAASKLLHGRRFDDEMLKERVFYMYLLPKRYGSPAFQNFLHASFGLALIRQSPVPHEGLGQPKHRLYVFVKKREPHKDAAT